MHVCRAWLQVQIRLSSSQEDAFIHANPKERCCGLEGGRWDWTAPLHLQMCNLCASCVTAPLSTDRVSNGLQNSTSKRTDSRPPSSQAGWSWTRARWFYVVPVCYIPSQFSWVRWVYVLSSPSKQNFLGISIPLFIHQF
jgi:hypothetical protein